jgi:hypothetical protein
LKNQFTALDESLSGFKPDGLAQWRVGEMANVLLNQAREAAPDSPVIKAIEDFKPSHDKSFVDEARVGTVRATLRQVAEALPAEPAPMPRGGPPSSGGVMDQEL